MRKSYFNTRAMLVASRSNKKQRNNLVWIRFFPTNENNDAVLADEYFKTHVGNNLSQDGLPKSGKKHCRYKFMRRFGCTRKLRGFKSDTAGEKILEKLGTRARDISTESFQDDLPNYCK